MVDTDKSAEFRPGPVDRSLCARPWIFKSTSCWLEQRNCRSRSADIRADANYDRLSPEHCKRGFGNLADRFPVCVGIRKLSGGALE
jgi:hypothetical protein